MIKYSMRFLLVLSFLFSAAHAAESQSGKGDYLQRSELQSFIQEMVDRHQFSETELKNWFAQVRPRSDIIESISNPAEGKPWYVYRTIFLKEKRIAGGVKFWRQHRNWLQTAEELTGVPASVIVAILGVETLYNTYKGRYPVLESLATLSFDYPKRAKFFRSEMEQFLLLAREEQVDPVTLIGSYAGAMGGPQFISSSFRRYAVDFNNDGKRDIWNDPADMIGSVANYFKLHGWVKDQPIAAKVNIDTKKLDSEILKSYKPGYSLTELQQAGIEIDKTGFPDIEAALIKLEQKKSDDFWLVFNNFYVITRYNHSPLYAMAVHQLSEEIEQRMKP